MRGAGEGSLPGTAAAGFWGCGACGQGCARWSV